MSLCTTSPLDAGRSAIGNMSYTGASCKGQGIGEYQCGIAQVHVGIADEGPEPADHFQALGVFRAQPAIAFE